MSVPADIAFTVAADVEHYSAFLPLLQSSKLIGVRQKTPTGETFQAALAVSYAKLGLAESFISTVTTHLQNREVKAISTDGPFRRVETMWTIVPAGLLSDVSIRIDYVFRNPLLQIAAAGLMDMAIKKVMAAFEARAKRVQSALITS